MGDRRRVDLTADSKDGLFLCPSDLNRGNFKKIKDGPVVALDFGAVCFLPPVFFYLAMHMSMATPRPATEVSDGSIVMQQLLTEGTLEIAVRPRTDPSRSARFTRSFHLKANITFGELLNVMTSRGTEPFQFSKIGMAYLGCRDSMCIISHYFSPAPSLINFLFFFLSIPFFFVMQWPDRWRVARRRSHAGSPLDRGDSQARARLLSPRLVLLSPSRRCR